MLHLFSWWTFSTPVSTVIGGVNASCVSWSKRDNRFSLRLVNFTGLLPVPRVVVERSIMVDHVYIARISSIWSEIFSNVWGVLDVLLSKSAFHRKVGQCSTSTAIGRGGGEERELEERHRNYQDEHSLECQPFRSVVDGSTKSSRSMKLPQ